MNESNFEQYKIDQQKLEVIPTIRAEFHLVVNDAAQKLLEGESFEEKDVGSLEMVYESTQDIEKEFITILDMYRSQDLISSEEFLLVAAYFLTAHQNGPDSKELKNELMRPTISDYGFVILAGTYSIPEHTQTLLAQVYKKIKAGLIA